MWRLHAAVAAASAAASHNRPRRAVVSCGACVRQGGVGHEGTAAYAFHDPELIYGVCDPSQSLCLAFANTAAAAAAAAVVVIAGGGVAVGW